MATNGLMGGIEFFTGIKSSSLYLTGQLSYLLSWAFPRTSLTFKLWLAPKSANSYMQKASFFIIKPPVPSELYTCF